MHAFVPQSPTNDVAWLKRFGERTSYFRILVFYAHHPDRALARIRTVLTGDAWQIRPNLSNFRRQEGRPPGAVTGRFSSWSSLRSWLFIHFPAHMPIWYALTLLGSPLLYWRARSRPLGGMFWIIFAVALTGLGEFGVAAFTDAPETFRHLLLFHLLTDSTIFLTIAAAFLVRAEAPCESRQ